jgi:hypothetical protein
MTYTKGIQLPGTIAVWILALVVGGCGQTETKSLRGQNVTSPDLTPKDIGEDDAVGKKGQVEKEKEKEPEKEQEKDPEEDPKKEEVIPLQKIQASVGLKNYEQINSSMSVITGIDATTPAVRTVFATLTTSMPTDNDIKGFLGSQQVSVFKLAVEYCDALTKDVAKRAAFFPGFNFAGTPAAVLNASGKQEIADTLVTKIWGKDLDFLPPHTESVATVMGLIDNILVGKNTATVAVTGAVVTGACTAVLASAPSIMY